MLRLEDLPPEIRLRIYDFVFQGTLVHPNPIMWAKQPSCDDKAKFERLQVEWPDPVGLLMTSKFFNTDPLTAKSFYKNAIFCFGVKWQWPAFMSFVRQKAGIAIDPARLITSIMDTTPLYSSESCLDLNQITVKTLASLKHVYLNLFSTFGKCTGRIISRVYGYESHDQFNCDGCKSDYRTPTYEYCEGNGYCGYHRSPDPSRFALQSPGTLIGREFETLNGMYYCSPSEFILSSFFNIHCTEEETSLFFYAYSRPETGHELKERIMNDHVTVHLSWEMVFDRGVYHETDIRVNSSFSSSDWKLRYNWNGKAYEVQQTRPKSFDSGTRKFLP